eukprot:424340_1
MARSTTNIKLSHKYIVCMVLIILSCFSTLYIFNQSSVKNYFMLSTNVDSITGITNESYNQSCSLLFKNNESITNDILFCKKEYVDIISVFFSYCNELTLYWFHRLLYSQTFLSTKITRYIFILIHNLNGKECILYNQNK